MNTRRYRGATILFSALLASTASAGDGGGGLVGWVENTHGTPLSGAVVSVFGKGIGSGGIVTLTDSAGQFVLPRLPVGSYTLRALGSGHVPAAARKFTVLPDLDSTFTLSLTPVGETPPAARPASASPEDPDAEAQREWRWLVRHKRRSVLEDLDDLVPLPPGSLLVADTLKARPSAPRSADLGGSVEFVASPVGALAPADVSMGGQGVLRLRGRLAEGIEWKLGGLVSESQRTSWRTAAEFVLEPGGGLSLETGAGYGVGLTQRVGALADEAIADPRGVGAMFLRGRWKLASHVTASLGTRYTYLGFLADPNHLDAMASIEIRSTPGTTVRGSMTSRTLAPGGDLLTLSTSDSSPLISYASIMEGLRASKTTSYELGVDRTVGATTLGARAFYEGTTDPVANVFDGQGTRSLRMFNVGALSARGVGITLGHRFGEAVRGSFTYTYGHAERGEFPMTQGVLHLVPASASFTQAGFHDLEASLETFIDLTDTRLTAFCRFNSMSPDSDGPGGAGAFSNTRFDIQLTQGLPFLQPLTRADWEVLVAFRNLFYERGEGGLIDELVVLHPPKRVVGGIAVRF